MYGLAHSHIYIKAEDPPPLFYCSVLIDLKARRIVFIIKKSNVKAGLFFVQFAALPCLRTLRRHSNLRILLSRTLLFFGN